MNMKKFSLKPLGGSYIEKICKSLFFIGLITTFSLTSCSDDDNDGNAAPIFPEKQNIVCNAGESKEFSFEANTDWSLTSSAIWCKFKKEDMDEEFVVSGKAGKQTITVIATDDEQQVNTVSVAKLELTMAGQTVVIGEVTRSAEGFELKIYDEEGNEIEALEAGYKEYAHFKVKANFRFAATNLPGWAELEGNSLVGAVDKEVQGGLKFIEDGNMEKYPIEASDKNVITFSDETGKAFFTFPIAYKGMNPTEIDITAPATNMYGWVVSLDGKSYVQNGGSLSGSSNLTYKNRIPFTIKTLKDEYQFVYIVKGLTGESLHIVESEDAWIYCEGEKGQIALGAEPFSVMPGVSERTGYVLAFSQAEYNQIKEDLEGSIFEDGEIAYKYAQNNLLIQLTQKETESSVEEQVFTARDGLTAAKIECTLYTGDDADYYKNKYNVKSISEIKEPSPKTMAVKASFEIWNAECYYLDEEEPANYIIEPAEEISVFTSEAGGKDIFIIATGETENDAAMLIVRTSNVSGGETEAVFSVADMMGNSYECTVYEQGFGSSIFLKSEYGLTEIFELKSSNTTSMSLVSFQSSDVIDFEMYTTEYEELDKSEYEDLIFIDEDPMGSGKQLMYVAGPALSETTFMIITRDDNKKYGLFIHR